MRFTITSSSSNYDVSKTDEIYLVSGSSNIYQVSLRAGKWILVGGIWDDIGLWQDDEVWIDE
jgi:hypothetical protein